MEVSRSTTWRCRTDLPKVRRAARGTAVAAAARVWAARSSTLVRSWYRTSSSPIIKPQVAGVEPTAGRRERAVMGAASTAAVAGHPSAQAEPTVGSAEEEEAHRRVEPAAVGLVDLE